MPKSISLKVSSLAAGAKRRLLDEKRWLRERGSSDRQPVDKKKGNIEDLAEKAGQLTDTLSGLTNVVVETLVSDNKLDVNLAKSDFARLEGTPRNLGDLAEEVGKLTDILSGLIGVVPKMIQLANKADLGLGVKP